MEENKEIIFKTNKYKIKIFTMVDFKNFCDINQDPVVAKYVNHNDGKPKTFRECVEKYNDIAYAQNKYGFSYWAIYDVNSNEFIGQCGAIKSWLGEINFCYAFRKKYWGKGIGTEICGLVRDYLFKNFKEIEELTCSAFSENIASVKLLKKLGFSVIKIEKEFNKDLEFFKLTRKEYEEKNI